MLPPSLAQWDTVLSSQHSRAQEQHFLWLTATPHPYHPQTSYEGTGPGSQLLSGSASREAGLGDQEKAARPIFPRALIIDRTSGELRGLLGLSLAYSIIDDLICLSTALPSPRG